MQELFEDNSSGHACFSVPELQKRLSLTRTAIRALQKEKEPLKSIHVEGLIRYCKETEKMMIELLLWKGVKTYENKEKTIDDMVDSL